MATVPMTARKFDVTGSVCFWKARRILRQDLIDAFDAVGVEGVPSIDHYDALAETGMRVAEVAKLKKTNCPIKAASLSRTGVGVEFYQTTKGDEKNEREFLFSLGVHPSTHRAFLIKVGDNADLQSFFAHPDHEAVVNGIYESNLLQMPSRDVTDALTGIMTRNRGVRLADGKGVWFVPESSFPMVDAVFNGLNNAGCSCAMLISNLTDNDKLCRQVLEATNDQLVGNLEKMQGEIRDILDDEKKKPRINGLKTKMADLAQYADMLSYYQQMFGTNLDAAQKNLDVTFELLSELQIRYRGNDSK